MDRRGEIASLTGLRGLAALLVVIGHFSVWTIVAPRSEMPTWIGQWGGATPGIGMSIFFTLSGYVIALSYAHWNWRERPGFNLVRFFFYRFARLYPAFFVFAILIVVRSPPLRDLSTPETQAYLAPHLLLWQSWLPVKYGGALVADDLFHVSWSLSAECGLYLLFGIGAIVVAALPPWQWKSRVVALVFIATAFALLQMAWVMRGDLAPDGWSSGDWYLWLFAFSPWGSQFSSVLVSRPICYPARRFFRDLQGSPATLAPQVLSRSTRSAPSALFGSKRPKRLSCRSPQRPSWWARGHRAGSIDS